MTQARSTPFGLIVRLALRDLRGGLKGFRIFLACVTIGVAAITGVAAVSQSLLASFEAQGRGMLGGDLAFGRSQRQLAADERAALTQFGAVSEIASLRAMARASDTKIVVVEIKAVDAAYPLMGAIETRPPLAPADALAQRDGAFGALADSALIERLGLRIGQSFTIGEGRFVLRGELLSEPDRLATGVGFGPRAMISTQALTASGLQGATSLMRWAARVALPAERPTSDARLKEIATGVQKQFPASGWDARTRANVSPQLTRNVERFSQFMAMIGVVSLIVGGVGVAAAVGAFVERRREAIAILKAVGAAGSAVVQMILIEMLLIAALGALLGAALGAAAPFALATVAGPLLDLPFAPILSWSAMATGLAIGVLAAVAFVIAPAGRAHDAPVAALFRLAATVERAPLRRAYALIAAACFAALVALVYALTTEKRIAAIAIAGVAASALILRAVAWAIARAAAAAPHVKSLVARLAIRNIHRPGAVTGPVVTSLGLGLTLLVAIVGVDGSVRRQLTAGQTGRTPDFFFLDVQSSRADDFRRLLVSRRPNDAIEQVPMLRGRIVKIGDRRSEDVRAQENAAWVLEGDRGITYANRPPEGSRVVEGAWWPADYRGEPLVSMDQDIAQGLGLKIGDAIAVNVAGRIIEAKLSNLRRVDWRSFGINFVLVFTPSTFAGAPHTELFTISAPQRAAKHDADLVRDVANAFPTVTALSVRDALDQALGLVEKLATAIRAASSVTIVTALLVLGGALAAGQRARLYDAVVLQTLGATRRRLIASYLIEFLILGAATAAFAIGAGSLAAWAIAKGLMDLDFYWNWPAMAGIVAIGCAVTILLGLGATWRVLGEKPARVLHDL